MGIITGNFGFLMQGVLITLELTVLGFVGALVLGTAMAVCRVGPITPLRVVGALYVEFFRNIPLLSLLVLVIFGLPDAGVTIGLFASAAICLALSGSAFVCEAMRGGINSVSVGQAEAARAIGLSFAQVLRHVILPQAFRAMVQPLVNVFIGVLLSSALAAAVGVPDLTNRTQQLNLQYAEAVTCFLFSGIVYLVVALGGAAVGGRLERRVAIRR
jgi:glutamate transport system permease protein